METTRSRSPLQLLPLMVHETVYQVGAPAGEHDLVPGDADRRVFDQAVAAVAGQRHRARVEQQSVPLGLAGLHRVGPWSGGAV